MSNFETQASQVCQLPSVLVLIIGPGDITSRSLLSGRNFCCSIPQKKLCPQGCHLQRLCLSGLMKPSLVTARKRTGSLSHIQPHPPHQVNRFFFLWWRLTCSKNPGTWPLTSYLFVVLEFLIVFLVSLILEDGGFAVNSSILPAEIEPTSFYFSSLNLKEQFYVCRSLTQRCTPGSKNLRMSLL